MLDFSELSGSPVCATNRGSLQCVSPRLINRHSSSHCLCLLSNPARHLLLFVFGMAPLFRLSLIVYKHSSFSSQAKQGILTLSIMSTVSICVSRSALWGPTFNIDGAFWKPLWAKREGPTSLAMLRVLCLLPPLLHPSSLTLSWSSFLWLAHHVLPSHPI